jgi:hypothetical protein
MGLCEDEAVNVACEITLLGEVVLFWALGTEDIGAIEGNHKGEVDTVYSKHEERDKFSAVFAAVVGNEVNQENGSVAYT